MGVCAVRRSRSGSDTRLDSLRKGPPIDSDRRRGLAIAPTAIANGRTQAKGIWKSGFCLCSLYPLFTGRVPLILVLVGTKLVFGTLHPFVADRGLTVKRPLWTNLHNVLRFRLMVSVPCTGKGDEIAVPARIEGPTWMILYKWPDIYFQ
jgi:hypothetical protein